MADIEKARLSGEAPRLPDAAILPIVKATTERAAPVKVAVHPAPYIIAWISLSSGVILFNKWLLSTMGFHFPIVLTTWHMCCATLMTQILARTTTLLDGRKTVKFTARTYIRAILPIGFLFSASLICGNKAYLYLSVSFIQMLKATSPVAVLLASWALGVASPSLKVLGNVSIIVIGVVIASLGEIQFDLTGFLFQLGGVTFEAFRLVLMQKLLNGAEYKMDPLVSLYYFAPVCGIMNGLTAILTEVPTMTMEDIYHVGFPVLIANASIAFLLNLSVVFLISKTSSLVFTLCGVLKDILLVGLSMMIWGTPVTATQFFGYGIALSGMLYYKFGGEQIKGYLNQARMKWDEFGLQKPAMRKAIVSGLVVVTVFLLLGGLAPTFAPHKTKELTDLFGGAALGTT